METNTPTADRTALPLTKGAPVLVNDATYGVVQYVTADGFFGVTLLGETRCDEWHPSQVRDASDPT